MIKVLIGLFPRFVFVFRFRVFLYRNLFGEGPSGSSVRAPPSSPRAGQGGMGRTVCAELRPVLLGLSDFASKGERRDAYVCKEGPSVRGSAKGPVFRDPYSFRGSFSFHLPLLC